MKVGDKLWKFHSGKLHCVIIDSIGFDTHYHYEGESIDRWIDTVIFKLHTFLTEEDAINNRLRELENKKKELENEIYETRQMLLPYIKF